MHGLKSTDADIHRIVKVVLRHILASATIIGIRQVNLCHRFCTLPPSKTYTLQHRSFPHFAVMSGSAYTIFRKQTKFTKHLSRSQPKNGRRKMQKHSLLVTLPPGSIHRSDLDFHSWKLNLSVQYNSLLHHSVCASSKVCRSSVLVKGRVLRRFRRCGLLA